MKMNARLKHPDVFSLKILKKGRLLRTCFNPVAFLFFVLWTMCMHEGAALAYSSGPPFGRTGSPADNFKTCKDTDCHNAYPLNYGTAKFSISPPANYSPGEVLPISVSFDNSVAERHGFQLSALDANNNHVGTFISTDDTTQVSNDGNYIEHTLEGCDQVGNAHWIVKWVAPSSEIQDPVTFYAAGNDANGHNHEEEEEEETAVQHPEHGDHGGDYIYTAIAQISRNSITPTPTPTPAGCEIISLEGSVHHLELEKGESSDVVITLIPSEGCQPEEGKVVTAKVNKSDRKRISVSPQNASTDSNGQAKFTITARKKTGKAKVKFGCEDCKKSVKVKVAE